MARYAPATYAAYLAFSAQRRRHFFQTYDEPKRTVVHHQVSRYGIERRGAACPLKFLAAELAMPRETVRRFLRELLADGSISRKGCGFIAAPVNLDLLVEQFLKAADLVHATLKA